MDWLVVRQPPVQRRGQKEAAAALAAGVGTGQGRGMQQVPAAAAAGPQAVRLCVEGLVTSDVEGHQGGGCECLLGTPCADTWLAGGVLTAGRPCMEKAPAAAAVVCLHVVTE